MSVLCVFVCVDQCGPRDVAQMCVDCSDVLHQVGLVVSNVPHALRYASFMRSDGWKENLATRALAATFGDVA